MPKNTNTLALASAVAGAIGWTAMPWIGTIAAIILGHMARAEIRKSGEEGDGLAILGLALGYSHLVVTCLIVGFVVVFYGGFIALMIANPR